MNPLPTPVSNAPRTNSAIVDAASPVPQNKSGVESAVARGASQDSKGCATGEPSRFSKHTIATSMAMEANTGSPLKNTCAPELPSPSSAQRLPVYPSTASV